MYVLHFLYPLATEGVFAQVLINTLMLEEHVGSACLSMRTSAVFQASDLIRLRIVPAGLLASALAAVQNFGQGVSNIFHKPVEVCNSSISTRYAAA